MIKTTADELTKGDFLAGYLKSNSAKKATRVFAEVTSVTLGKWDPKHREWVPQWADELYTMPPAIEVVTAKGTLVLSPKSPVWTGRPEPKAAPKPATPACCPWCYMQLTTTGDCPMGC